MANQDQKKPEPAKKQAPSDGEPIRHKGGDRSTTEERHSGQQPDGNGGTGQPAAFPPHN